MADEYVDPDLIRGAFLAIKSGELFEEFGKLFLAAYRGEDFVPAGTIHDRGIDGLERIYQFRSVQTTIYQLSSEANPDTKLGKTLEVLRNNKINYSRLVYVTNRKVKERDQLLDKYSYAFDKSIDIYDVEWFATHVNRSTETARAFRVFLDAKFSMLPSPSEGLIVGDFGTDPRVFVYLQHQVNDSEGSQRLDEALVDALIFYVLEGTDATKNEFKTVQQIQDAIRSIVKFDPQLLGDMLELRLQSLSTKDSKGLRKVHWHEKAQGYCLPYETTMAIHARDLKDGLLFDTFLQSTSELLSKQLGEIRVKQPAQLISAAIHKIFCSQGLEFANHLLAGTSASAFDRRVADTIIEVMEESAIVNSNRERVGAALHFTIRQLVYRGTTEQTRANAPNG